MDKLLLNIRLMNFKHLISISFCLMFCLFAAAQNRSDPKPVFVIVHGAWGGSWAFKKVDSLMTEKNTVVYRPSLTGQGERVHLASLEVGLKTHINDVVNMILFEDLHNVVLVGHSYGGMVITGVADSVGSRISRLVYLDAMVPESGESVMTAHGGNADRFRNSAVNGFLVPAWVPAGKLPPKDVPHPLKTFTDTLILKRPAGNNIPATYILTVAKGVKPENDDFARHAERAKKRGWQMMHMEADHNPQWSAPEVLADMLLKLAGK
jgi:pimeloyl-ACP methyl ester carboxylesterase